MHHLSSLHQDAMLYAICHINASCVFRFILIPDYFGLTRSSCLVVIETFLCGVLHIQAVTEDIVYTV